jgi:hypothetical protein
MVSLSERPDEAGDWVAHERADQGASWRWMDVGTDTNFHPFNCPMILAALS